MTTEDPGKRDACAAATRRFPDFELPIRRLLAVDENFRDICEELAEAEHALAMVDDMPAASRAARRAEWQELIGRLLVEIEASLGSDGSASSGDRSRV